MSILWRSWLTFAVVMATVLAILASLSILQHNAILSDLTRGRVAVVAHTTATAFRAITDLGLPLSAMRNGDEIVARARLTDPTISAIEVFDPTGNTVYSTADDRTAPIPAAVLRAQQLAAGPAWNLETAADLDSGYSVLNQAGTVLGGVVVSYPKDEFNAAADANARRMVWQVLLLWLAFSALALVILRFLLAAPLRGLAHLEALPENLREHGTAAPRAPPAAGAGVLDGETRGLRTKLSAALTRFDEAMAGLRRLAPDGRADPVPAAGVESQPVMVEPSGNVSLARVIAYRLVPWAALLILSSALILGLLALRDVNRSVEPELAARTALIGTVVSANVQRAVSAGIPLDDLVGAERYFGDFLSDLPEVAYIAVATGRIVLEAGKRIDPYLAPPRDRKDVLTHPILYDDEEIGYVIIDIDPAFIAKQFLDVFLDQGVVVLVTVLLAFEVLVLMLSRSLTAPLDRLQHLATLQAAGDFSKRLVVGAGNTIDRMATLLSEHAMSLHGAFTRAQGAAPAGLRALAERYHLSAARPARLIFPYFTDIRLALFLFAAADELPISFLPLYTRAATNPWGWLDQGVVLSLPLAGYLVAVVIGAPFARTLALRFGHRNLVALAMGPTLLAHLGLYAATSVPEIVAWRTVTGFGYAIVTLACQDYLLDVLPRGQRDRSLGLYATVLFGGTFCGTAMGGVLADRLGQSAVFLVSATLIATSALLILWLVARIEHAERAGKPDPPMPAIWAPLANRRFFVLVAGIAIPANVVLQAFICYLVTLMLDSQGASVADIGRTLMLYFLMIALVGPLAARLAEGWLSVAQVALAGALLSGAILALPALWPGELTILAAVVCCGIAHGMLRGPQVSLAMTIAETELTALGSTAVLGGLRTLERGGSVLGLLGIAFLSGTIGYPGAIAAMSLWVLGGAALFFLSALADRAQR